MNLIRLLRRQWLIASLPVHLIYLLSTNYLYTLGRWVQDWLVYSIAALCVPLCVWVLI